MPRYKLTGFSVHRPWNDEEGRKRLETMLALHGDVRFVGLEDDRATIKLVLDAADDVDAKTRRPAALRSVFGNSYGFGGPDRIVASDLVDPFPDHPPTAAS